MLRRLRPLEKVRRRPSQAFKKAGGAVGAQPVSALADKTLVAGFLLLIGLPLVGMIFGFDRAFVLEENRVLVNRPELKPTLGAIGAFPAKFEAYFNDQFGFRKRLIYWLAIVKVSGLGVTSTSGVMLGRDGWLYLASDVAISSFRATRPFTPEELEGYRQIVEARRDWLAERGIPYVMIVAPNKDTIYPEFVPPTLNKVHQRSRLDQLVEHMRSRSTVEFIDVRNDLWQAKQFEPVYDATDSHWNAIGGYIAYSRIMDAVHASLPQARAIPRSELRLTVEKGPGGDLARMLGIADRLPELRRKLGPSDHWHFHHTDLALPISKGDHPELTTATELADAKLPRAVLFRDSFAAQLIPFLAEDFQRILCIWNTDFERAMVEFEHPVVVIQEVVERSLEGALPVDR
jgi:alginate O-acetyltransferase complex protein AlgJ